MGTARMKEDKKAEDETTEACRAQNKPQRLNYSTGSYVVIYYIYY